MKKIRISSITMIAAAVAMIITTSVSAKPVGRARGMHAAAAKAGPRSAKHTKTKCWVIACSGESSICYAWGDVFSTSFQIEVGTMSRYQVDCSKLHLSGSVHNRLFTFDPSDPNHEAGYGWTNCDAWVNGSEAYIEEYDDSGLQTTFSQWQSAP